MSGEKSPVRETQERGLYCLCKHFSAYFDQCVNEQQADFGKPCVGCKYAESCQLNWMENIISIMNGCGVSIKLGDWKR